MSLITSEILAKIAPSTPRAKRDRFIDDYNRVFPMYGVTNRFRVAACLTTICFESDYFKALTEYASGWDYDISKNRKKALALGNTEKGDGPKYKGATGIETTGKKNYQRLTDRIGKRDGVDFVKNPELLHGTEYFVEGACIFWDDNHFNKLADAGDITSIQNITNRGSANKPAKNLTKRLQVYHTVLAALPLDFKLDSASSDTLPTVKPPTSTDETPVIPPQEAPKDTGGDFTEGTPTQEIKVESKGDTTILGKIDKAGDKWTAIQATLEKFGVSDPTAARSKGTLILTVGKSVFAVLLTVGTFVTQNWEYLVLAGFVITLAVVLWDRSGKRVADAKAGVPLEVLEQTK